MLTQKASACPGETETLKFRLALKIGELTFHQQSLVDRIGFFRHRLRVPRKEIPQRQCLGQHLSEWKEWDKFNGSPHMRAEIR